MTIVDRKTGTIRWFNKTKGFGFIRVNMGVDVFIHHSSIVPDGYTDINEGDTVEFEMINDSKGPQANKVVFLGKSLAQ
jgi:CspA family cold shock protein